MVSPSWYLLPNLSGIIFKTQRSISAVLGTLKRLYLGVLVHINISENEEELTEIWYPPPGTSNFPTYLGLSSKRDGQFGGPWRVEKAVFRCISAYRYLPKWHRTHGALPAPGTQNPFRHILIFGFLLENDNNKCES
jgi:hypothetical protein